MHRNVNLNVKKGVQQLKLDEFKADFQSLLIQFMEFQGLEF